MRLIDADRLLDMLYDNEYTMLCPLDEVSGVVDACQTVDAVPVVRCKDIDGGKTSLNTDEIPFPYIKAYRKALRDVADWVERHEQ